MVLTENCISLNQSEWRNFFLYIIIAVTNYSPQAGYFLYRCIPSLQLWISLSVTGFGLRSLWSFSFVSLALSARFSPSEFAGLKKEKPLTASSLYNKFVLPSLCKFVVVLDKFALPRPRRVDIVTIWSSTKILNLALGNLRSVGFSDLCSFNKRA